jgi:hypothetical protein
MAALGVEFMVLELSNGDPLPQRMYVDAFDEVVIVRREMNAIDQCGRHESAIVNFSRARSSERNCKLGERPLEVASIAYPYLPK